MNDPRLADLLQRFLQEEINDQEFAELEQRLRDDPAARAAYLQAVNLDSALRDRAARDDQASAWLTRPPAPRGRPRWYLGLGLATAAAVCCAAYYLGGYAPRPAPPVAEATAQGAAVLTQTFDAEWGGLAPPRRAGTTLAPGRLSLRSGLAQIEFYSGAALVVSGPAEFEIVSPWKVVWLGGKARVKVPPAAHGFELSTPKIKVIDLGTEFGVDVDARTSDSRLQVFSGEIEAHPAIGAQLNLKEGQGLEQRGAALTSFTTMRPEDFPSVERVGDLGRERAQRQFERWRQFSLAQRRDPRLLAYYSMEPDSPGQRLVRNRAEPANAARDGGAVGAGWTTGRWPQKGALEFKGPGDRVRLHIDGTYEAVSFACWAKVDGLDRRYNALFLTDGYEPGEPHWQILDDGRLMFSVSYPDPANPGTARNQRYYSPVVFDHLRTGRWHHLAVTYENRTGAVVHYVDGVEIGREIDPQHVPGRPLLFGASELGNWGLPTANHKFPIRNLNGRLDEFAIYSAALSADDIRAMYEAGRPE